MSPATLGLVVPTFHLHRRAGRTEASDRKLKRQEAQRQPLLFLNWKGTATTFPRVRFPSWYVYVPISEVSPIKNLLTWTTFTLTVTPLMSIYRRQGHECCRLSYKWWESELTSERHDVSGLQRVVEHFAFPCPLHIRWEGRKDVYYISQNLKTFYFPNFCEIATDKAIKSNTEFATWSQSVRQHLMEAPNNTTFVYCR